MFTKIYTTYAPDTDITFIMKDTYEYTRDKTNTFLASTEVIGFYFGEPDESNTAEYTGKLKAEF